MFLNPGELEVKFSKYPFILDNTRRLMDQCHMDFPDGKVKLNRKSFTGNQRDDRVLLEKLVLEGMVYRYGKTNKEAQRRLKYELKVIYDMNFCSYFLITWDIIRYSMSRGYYHVGRGSGANSLVAYCLRITDVDPIELDLYFERFLNEQRSSAPDFDLDFSWDEREDVQNYIFKRYGSTHTALLGTMTTFRDRSVIREIGKVMDLPKAEIDGFTDRSKEQQNRANETFKKIQVIHRLMSDMPNQRSIHAGGVLPELTTTALEDAYHELELLGYPVSLSMFELLKTSFRGNVMSKQMNTHIGSVVRMVGLYVCEKTVHTKSNKKMWFGTFLDVKRDFFDTVHFPGSTPSYPFRGAGCYLIEGKVVEDFGCAGLEVIRFAKLEIKGNPVME